MMRYQHVAGEDRDAGRGATASAQVEDIELDARLRATRHPVPDGEDFRRRATAYTQVDDDEDAGPRATMHTVPDRVDAGPPAPIATAVEAGARFGHLAASRPWEQVSPAASATESGPSNRTEKGSAPYSGKKSHSLKGWWTEAGILFLGFGLLAAIISVLATYHGKVQPKWKYRINLNTLAAVMSTVLRACLISVVEEVISQLKWYWHRQPRPLQHLSYFDRASRGPWGSFLFPIRLRKFSIAQLGCFLTLASFAIGPFTQQAVRSVPCDRDSPNFRPFFQTASKIEMGAITRVGPATYSIDGPTKGAVISALADPVANQSLAGIMGGCGTGNCTFPAENGITHSTIGMCTKCIDTTRFIEWVPGVMGNESTPGTESSMRLPNGLNITGPPFTCLTSQFDNSLDWMISLADDEFHAAGESGIVKWTSLQSTAVGCDYGTNHSTHPGTWDCDRTKSMNVSGNDEFVTLNYIATTCVVYPCTRHYHGRVQEGELTQSLVSEIPAPVFADDDLIEAVSTGPMYHDPGYGYAPFAGLKRECSVNGARLWLAKVKRFAPDSAHQSPREQEMHGYHFHPTKATFNATTEGGSTVNLPMDCINPISGLFVEAIRSFLASILPGSCALPTPPSGFPYGDDYYGPWFHEYRDFSYVNCKTDVLAESWWLNGFYNGGNATHDTIAGTVGAMAEAMTSRMRLVGVSKDTNQSEKVFGKASHTTICTEFDAWWMAMPAAALALGTLFLAIAVVQSTYDGNPPLWKSSVLPLVFANPGELGEPAGSMKEMEQAAKVIEVELVKTGNGWEFVGGPGHSQVGSGRATPV